MRKFFKIYSMAALAVTTISVFSYCSKKNAQDKAIPLTDGQSVVQGIDPKASFTTGSVQIQTNNAGDVVVIMKTDSAVNDKLFILQGNTKKAILDKTFKKAQIAYLFHSIIINSLDSKERFYLAVDKQEEKDVLTKVPSSYKSFFTGSLYGYGIVQMTGPIPPNLTFFKKTSDTYKDISAYRASVSPNMAPPDSTGSKSCDNGGTGATSCSAGNGNGTCSVSCGTAYYACCTVHVLSAPTCGCVSISAQ